MTVKRRALSICTAFLTALTLILTIAGQTSALEDPWTWTQRYDGPRHLNAVAAGNGAFVAVGNEGAIMSSPDGIEWTDINSGTSRRLNSVIWGDGMFVAGGDSGTIVTSADGTDWTVRHSEGSEPIHSIVWGGRKYVAVERSFSTFTSDNGIEWVKQQKIFNDGYSNRPHSIVYGDELFMAGKEECGLFISNDGLNWEHSGHPLLWEAECRYIYPCTFNHPCMPDCMPISSIASGNGISLLLGGAVLARYEKDKGWDIIYYDYTVYDNAFSCWGFKDVKLGHSLMFDGTRFVMAGRGIYFTEDGGIFELASTRQFNRGTSIAYNGEVYVTVNGTEIGTLSGTRASVNPRQSAKQQFTQFVTVSGRTLNLRFTERSSVGIYTLNGARIRNFDLNQGVHTLRLNDLPRGMYVVRAKSGVWSQSARVLIK